MRRSRTTTCLTRLLGVTDPDVVFRSTFTALFDVGDRT